ncbi:MAG: CocE/NonD family hydrolase, partial [Ignavibacteriaceae bacterium]|nr:CocE/NonD family hydrolase [Ignavibacteriaceae bacterium]
MVPLRDGIKLATDIYFPGKNGVKVDAKFPVILTRTPYGKHETAHGRDHNGYVPYGYIMIKQDTRGRGNSEGVWHWMTDDRIDGYDTVEWIAQQPWCSGKIGMIGCSYHGATQHLAAMEQPPHLTTIVPNDPSINHGIGGIRYGGAFRLRVWYWIYTRAALGSRQARNPAIKAELEKQAKDRRHYLLNLPLRKGLTPLRLAPEYEDTLIDMLEHGKNDEFWRFNNIIEYVDEHKDIPVFMLGGWYDLFSSSTTETWMALRKSKKSPMYLLMGPWIHGSTSRSNGQVDFGEDAAMDQITMRRIWYDRWLKGIEKDFNNQIPFRTPVRIFVMGTGDGHKTESGKLFHGGEWREYQNYPLPQVQDTRFYIHEDGTLSSEKPGNTDSSVTFEFDPENPVPTVGGCTCCSEGIMTTGAWNQWGGEHTWTWPVPIPLSARNDVIVFQTEPLESDTEIVGQ